jgi:hypothetical protein
MSYKPGDYLVICDICGFKKLRSECRKNWKNQLVCADTCYEQKHPQLTPRVHIDKIRVQEPRPEHADKFVGSRDITADDL